VKWLMLYARVEKAGMAGYSTKNPWEFLFRPGFGIFRLPRSVVKSGLQMLQESYQFPVSIPQTQ
jgi:hypothetical protein